jgi:peptidoglycan/LPS O-acetylase OafA/YrhL
VSSRAADPISGASGVARADGSMTDVMHGRLTRVDALRAIAVMLVMVHHVVSPPDYAPPAAAALIELAQGPSWIGVDLFFVLSGFIITSLLVEEWQRDRSVNLREFYVRRGRRLFPALVVLVGVFALLTLLAVPARAPETGIEALLRVSYVANFLIAFTQNGVGVGFAHLWSLSLEEQFYLLWPPALLLLLRRRVSPSRLLLVLLMVIAAVNLQRLAVVAGGGDRHRIWFAPDTHSDAIVFGCAAALVWKYRLLRISPTRWAWAPVGAVLVGAFIAFDPLRTSTFPATLPLFALARAVGIVLLIDSPAALPARFFATRPMQTMGKVSYSLYLWHAPLIVFFGIIGLPVAVLASFLSYHYVEEPFRRRSRPPIALSAPARAR